MAGFLSHQGQPACSGLERQCPACAQSTCVLCHIGGNRAERDHRRRPITAGPSLGEAADGFLARRYLNDGTLRSYRQTVTRLRRELGDRAALADTGPEAAAAMFAAAWGTCAARTDCLPCYSRYIGNNMPIPRSDRPRESSLRGHHPLHRSAGNRANHGGQFNQHWVATENPSPDVRADYPPPQRSCRAGGASRGRRGGVSLGRLPWS
jgi:hypothetical protein